MQLIIIKDEFDVAGFLKLTLKYVVSAISMFVVCVIVGNFTTGIVSVMLQILLGALAYFSILYFMKDEYLMLGINRFSNMIKSKFTGKSI